MRAPGANLVQAEMTAQSQFMSTVESQPIPQSGSLRWSLPDASLQLAGLELPIGREDERGAEEGFQRWVEAIWNMRSRSEENVIDRPAEPKSWLSRNHGMISGEWRTTRYGRTWTS